MLQSTGSRGWEGYLRRVLRVKGDGRRLAVTLGFSESTQKMEECSHGSVYATLGFDPGKHASLAFRQVIFPSLGFNFIFGNVTHSLCHLVR